MKDYQLQDGGEREDFGSGAIREPDTGKPRYDLIPPMPLERLAVNMAKGAAKYSEHNWNKGMPASRLLAAAMRHIEAARAGRKDEDHWAAAVFNIFGIMHFEGTEWDDLHEW